MQPIKLNLTMAQAADASAISRSSLYELIGAGELLSIKIGRRRYITVASLEDYLRRLSEEQNGAAA
ncbi:helix-turn-helix domain-containing protein [Streptomyces sp. NPDC127040]|uniref:helix-turn-helix domain-containing protein n=1 Tax=Streptomyces sp. NPDC127040 TaxID=3347116 RepID=UPI00364DBD0D